MVRDAVKGDLGIIESIEQECFGDEAWSKDMLLGDFNVRSHYKVANTEDGDVAGYASMLLLEGEAEILRIAVRKRYRKKGFGTALLNAIIEECYSRAFEKLHLEVKDSNEPAKAMYIKAGFYEVARRKAYYPDGSDAVIMSRLL